MSILSTLNKLTGKQDKSILAALNSLTGKTADDIEEAMGNLSSGGSVPMTKIVLLKGPYDEEVSPLFQGNVSNGRVKYTYFDDAEHLAEFTLTDSLSDVYGGAVLIGEIPAGAHIPHGLGGAHTIVIGNSNESDDYRFSSSQMVSIVAAHGVFVPASEDPVPLFVEKIEGGSV